MYQYSVFSNCRVVMWIGTTVSVPTVNAAVTCMQSLMDLKLLAEQKTFVAHRALEWFVSTVNQAVLTQCALVYKGLSADVASIRTFTSM